MTAIEEDSRNDHTSRRRVVSLLLAWGALVVLVVAAASSGDEPLWTAPPDSPSGPVEREEPVVAAPPASPADEESGTWLSGAGPMLAGLAALLSLVVVVVAVTTLVRGWSGRRWIPDLPRRGRRRVGSFEPLPIVSQPVEPDERAAFAALADGPPRNAIVRCWMVLEEDAASAGVRRAPFETSSEYAERVIAASSVDPRPIAELAELFREARFSSREVGEDQRAHAHLALRQTLRSLQHREAARA